MNKRNCNKYVLKDGHKIVYVGITNNIDRRQFEHESSKNFTHLMKVGRACSEESAKKWERQKLASYRRNHNGFNPKYNLTRNG